MRVPIFLGKRAYFFPREDFPEEKRRKKMGAFGILLVISRDMGYFSQASQEI